MNTPLHDFAVEALKINTFLEEYITSPEIRLSYVLGILGGHPHPAQVEELLVAPAAPTAVRRAKARSRKQEDDLAARTYEPVSPELGPVTFHPNPGTITQTMQDGAQNPKAEARRRYDVWADNVVIGDIKDTDQVSEIIGLELFKNQHGARTTVGNIMRQDPLRWRQMMTKSGGPQRRWGGSNMWQRIDGSEPDRVAGAAEVALEAARYKSAARQRKYRKNRSNSARAEA